MPTFNQGKKHSNILICYNKIGKVNCNVHSTKCWYSSLKQICIYFYIQDWLCSAEVSVILAHQAILSTVWKLLNALKITVSIVCCKIKLQNIYNSFLN